MKVKAKKDGFYGGKFRKEGDEFTLTAITEVAGEKLSAAKSKESIEKQFSKQWMIKL